MNIILAWMILLLFLGSVIIGAIFYPPVLLSLLIVLGSALFIGLIFVLGLALQRLAEEYF